MVPGVDGSPHGPGKTAAAVAGVLAGAAGRGGATKLVSHDDPQAVELIAAAAVQASTALRALRPVV